MNDSFGEMLEETDYNSEIELRIMQTERNRKITFQLRKVRICIEDGGSDDQILQLLDNVKAVVQGKVLVNDKPESALIVNSEGIRNEIVYNLEDQLNHSNDNLDQSGNIPNYDLDLILDLEITKNKRLDLLEEKLGTEKTKHDELTKEMQYRLDIFKKERDEAIKELSQLKLKQLEDFHKIEEETAKKLEQKRLDFENEIDLINKQKMDKLKESKTRLDEIKNRADKDVDEFVTKYINVSKELRNQKVLVQEISNSSEQKMIDLNNQFRMRLKTVEDEAAEKAEKRIISERKILKEETDKKIAHTKFLLESMNKTHALETITKNEQIHLLFKALNNRNNDCDQLKGIIEDFKLRIE